MPYKIIVQEITDVNYVNKEWKCRWSDDVFKSTVRPDMLKKGTEDPDQYGYVETDASRTETKTLYEQTLPKLDLSSIIAAANNLNQFISVPTL